MPKSIRCSCEGCRKKLQLVDTLSGVCRCGGTFCMKHRSPEDHSCTFNWHEVKKAELSDELNRGKCVAKKLEAC